MQGSFLLPHLSCLSSPGPLPLPPPPPPADELLWLSPVLWMKTAFLLGKDFGTIFYEHSFSNVNVEPLGILSEPADSKC